jgi:DNA-binding transcriptional ArsR family regulator
MRENRPVLDEPAIIRMLAHPLRLDLLNHLMDAGTATASQCARAVGDTPSNCSYHLRMLARHGLVTDDPSTDGRERPWRALLTGFSVPDGDDEATTTLNALALQRDQQLARRHLATQRRLPAPWRDASTHNTYGLRLTATELTDLAQRLDALIRPYISATRPDAPPDAELVHLGLHAFPTDASLLGPDSPPGGPSGAGAGGGAGGGAGAGGAAGAGA